MCNAGIRSENASTWHLHCLFLVDDLIATFIRNLVKNVVKLKRVKEENLFEIEMIQWNKKKKSTMFNQMKEFVDSLVAVITIYQRQS